MLEQSNQRTEIALAQRKVQEPSQQQNAADIAFTQTQCVTESNETLAALSCEQRVADREKMSRTSQSERLRQVIQVETEQKKNCVKVTSVSVCLFD